MKTRIPSPFLALLKLIASLSSHATCLFMVAFVLTATVAANADQFAYIVGNNDAEGTSHFGKIDVTTGSFQQIGPNAPLGTEGLAAGTNGSLFTISYNSDLYSINPVTGAYTRVGATGLGDCATPSSPCGPTSNLTLGSANGIIYATDFQNNLYSVNPLTAAATLVGHTGIPAVPAVPASFNPDGTINFYEEALFGANGKLYATFDALTFDLATSAPVAISVAPMLYEINTFTGTATVIASTDLSIGSVVRVDGVNYGFNLLEGQVTSLDLTSGTTTFVSATDSAAGTIRGSAAVVPEPVPMALVAIGVTAIFVARRHKRSLGRFAKRSCSQPS